MSCLLGITRIMPVFGRRRPSERVWAGSGVITLLSSNASQRALKRLLQAFVFLPCVSDGLFFMKTSAYAVSFVDLRFRFCYIIRIDLIQHRFDGLYRLLCNYDAFERLGAG